MLSWIKKSIHHKLRTVILDDEKNVRKSIKQIVSMHFPEIRLMAEADGTDSGIQVITRYHPELVLLGMRMKDGPCFDLLDRLKPVDFKVIFLLSYDRPLIRELRCCALEYLIKPVDPEDLAESLKKTGKMNMPELNMQLKVLEENLKTQNKLKKRIILKTPDAMQVAWLPDIVYCENLDKHTCFHLVNGKKILVWNTLNDYDEMLSESGFFRSHKSMLINLIHINRFEKGAGGNIVLTNENVLPVSSRKRDQLLEMLGRINGKLTG